MAAGQRFQEDVEEEVKDTVSSTYLTVPDELAGHFLSCRAHGAKLRRLNTNH